MAISMRREHRLLLLSLVLGAADGLRVRPVSRRVVSLAAAAALSPGRSYATPPTFVSGKQRQGLGQFVKGFNNAVISGDVAAVQEAAKLFDLVIDEETATIAIKTAGSPDGNLPVIVETRTGLTSTKVTVRVEGASMTSDRFIKLLYLRNADTKDVITCRELTKLSETPEMVQATVPKGLRVEPVAWSNRNGVWVGEAVMT